MHSNLKLNGFLLPVAVMKVISILPVLILAPLLELVHTCYQSPKKILPSPATFISEHPNYTIPLCPSKILKINPHVSVKITVYKRLIFSKKFSIYINCSHTYRYKIHSFQQKSTRSGEGERFRNAFKLVKQIRHVGSLGLKVTSV